MGLCVSRDFPPELWYALHETRRELPEFTNCLPPPDRERLKSRVGYGKLETDFRRKPETDLIQKEEVDELEKCEYCGAELAEEEQVCPYCGKAREESAEEPEQIAEAAEAEEVSEAAEETANAAEETLPEEEPKKKNRTPLILGCVIGVLVIAIVALVIALLSKKAEPKPEPEQSAPSATSEEVQPGAQEAAGTEEETEPAGNGVSYTVAAEEITPELTAKTAATCGDDTMTVGMLNLYYWQQYYSFASSYSMYLSYLMDTSVPFDQQMYDETTTWQQMFLEGALGMYGRISAVCQEGRKAGYVLGEEEQEYLDTLEENLNADAAAYGYEDANAYIQEAFGPMVTMEDYLRFVSDNIYANCYLNELVAQQSYTEEDISAYFDEHAESYAASGIQKLDKPNVDVRHILIMPEEYDEDGNYTDAAWETARQKAQEIYDQWLAGEMTEESFAELAKENSVDGSAADGGMIADIYPGQTVQAFNDWCFADERQVGDHALVKTEYGYHVLYFSAVGDEIYWYAVAESDYYNDLAISIEDGVTEKYPWEAEYDNIALFDVLAAQQAAAAAAEQ